jgi:hypothetical protein
MYSVRTYNTIQQAVSGLLANFIAGMVMHCVSNKLFMVIGAVTYVRHLRCTDQRLVSADIPLLVLSVVGGDFQFTITNCSDIVFAVGAARKSLQYCDDSQLG